MLLFFMVLVFISTLYIISQWPYTPEDAIRQGSKFGSYAIAIDLGILGFFAYHQQVLKDCKTVKK